MLNSTINEERFIIEIERELPIEACIEKYKDNVQTKQVKEKQHVFNLSR